MRGDIGAFSPSEKYSFNRVPKAVKACILDIFLMINDQCLFPLTPEGGTAHWSLKNVAKIQFFLQKSRMFFSEERRMNRNVVSLV